MNGEELEILFDNPYDSDYSSSDEHISSEPPSVSENLAAPWMSESTASIPNPAFRLHNELIEFFAYVSLDDKAILVRKEAIERISDILRLIDGCVIQCFGSFELGLSLPFSDVDLVVIHPNISPFELLRKASDLLRSEDSPFEVEELFSAKVPILKLVDRKSLLRIDISDTRSNQSSMTEAIKQRLRAWPEAKFLIMPLKLALRQREMNLTFTGGISPFLLTMMVLSFLAHFKEKKGLSDPSKRAGVSLAEYFIEFLFFWGQNFFYRTEEVELSPLLDSAEFRRKQTPDDKLTIITPEKKENSASGSFKAFNVLKLFRNRAFLMQGLAFVEKESVLKYLINPSGKDFSAYLK